MLYAFDPPSDTSPDIHWTEILTIITVTTMVFEEIRQVRMLYSISTCNFNSNLAFHYKFFLQDHRSLKSKLLTYFDFNNRLSNACLVVPSYLLFYIALILRFVLTDASSFSTARYLHSPGIFTHCVFNFLFGSRIVMAYDLEIWFIRSVLFVGIAPDLGPKLVMIRKMVIIIDEFEISVKCFSW